MSSRPTLSARLSGVPGRLKSSNGNKSSNGSRSGSPKPSPKANMSEARTNCLQLKTTVIKGRNLAAKDKSGTSDPVRPSVGNITAALSSTDSSSTVCSAHTRRLSRSYLRHIQDIEPRMEPDLRPSNNWGRGISA